MSHHPKSLWGIISRAVKEIESLNNFYLGNQSWNIIKQMEREIIEQQSQTEAEIRDIYQKHIDELEHMIFECVSLSDVMRNGLSEETYRAIIKKMEKQR